jgi:hypothetical protein
MDRLHRSALLHRTFAQTGGDGLRNQELGFFPLPGRPVARPDTSTANNNKWVLAVSYSSLLLYLLLTNCRSLLNKASVDAKILTQRTLSAVMLIFTSLL